MQLCAGNLYGGVETFLVTLAQCRRMAPGMTSEFGICFQGRLWDELSGTGVPIHDLGPTRISRPWSVLRARWRLGELLKRVRYDVVICHHPWAFILFSDLARRQVGGVVAHVHSPPGESWIDWVMTKYRPSLLIGPSQHTVSAYRRRIPDVAVEILNYPIPSQIIDLPPLTPGRRSDIRAQLGASPTDVVILNASRIEAWKGPDRTVRALARIQDIQGWQLWQAGGVQRPSEQALFEQIKRVAADAGIADRVKFLGMRTDVPALMRAADIYCQGNRGPEGYSLSFLEASYCGLPIVTTDIGGASELIDEKTGILVPPVEDVEELAQALRTLIISPDRRLAMSIQANARAVSLSDTAQQLNRLAKVVEGVRG